MHPYNAMRAVGGAIFLAGAVMMLVNVVMTVLTANSQGSVQRARTATAAATA